MRKTLKLYKINELNKDAKEKALDHYRSKNYEIFWASELFESLKALFDHCEGVKLVDYNLAEYHSRIDVEFSNSDVEDFTGKRAIAWLENNLYSSLRVSYYGEERKKFREYGEGYKAGQIESCPLTGVCFDEDFIACLNDSIKGGMTLKDSFQSLADEYQKLLNQEIESQNSEEYIIEHMDANEYEFLEDGTRF